MMSTQNQVAEHGSVIHSSIALLQERFKELQRVKEMREKKQLLTLFSHNYNLTPCTSPDSYPTAPQNTITTSKKIHVDDVVMVDDDNDDDDELQIFLPPNYYYTSNYSRNATNKATTSCYSSSSTFANQNNYKNDYHNTKLSEISLSLWPPTAMSYSNKPTVTVTATAAGERQAPVSTLSNRPPSSCVSSETSVSDVDTTLHL